MRGEHKPSSSMFLNLPGSSPHARGAQHADRVGGNASGIIPACAGSTPRGAKPSLVAGDHPRMRGEHAMPRSFESILRGSSPHARGAPQRPAYLGCLGGIIPACAGSTRT